MQASIVGPAAGAPTAAPAPLGRGVVDSIGNTPLFRLPHLAVPAGVQLLVKAEWYNPGGSVKDRAAKYIIEDALRRGLLGNGRTLIDSTSGNTGIGYAMVGAALGIPVALVMPENVSSERIQRARAYGATIMFSDPLEGSDGAIRMVRQLAADRPDAYWYANQYNNAANVRAHMETTGPEIMAQTEGRVTHFVAGLGTSGTLVGVGRYLKRVKPSSRIVAVEPADELQVIEGLKHMASAIVPGIYDPSVHNEQIAVEAEDAWQMTRWLARSEGLFVGFSSGAAVHAAVQVARSLREGVIVALLPDSGDKYLSTRLFE
ncbi:MAG: cysteine synthase family protein [Chloroflexi bacterium]|nr:cysteine synthase family protein [Chloroflexota bacterium]